MPWVSSQQIFDASLGFHLLVQSPNSRAPSSVVIADAFLAEKAHKLYHVLHHPEIAFDDRHRGVSRTQSKILDPPPRLDTKEPVWYQQAVLRE
jgi:hypothetical protein